MQIYYTETGILLLSSNFCISTVFDNFFEKINKATMSVHLLQEIGFNAEMCHVYAEFITT